MPWWYWLPTARRVCFQSAQFRDEIFLFTTLTLPFEKLHSQVDLNVTSKDPDHAAIRDKLQLPLLDAFKRGQRQRLMPWEWGWWSGVNHKTNQGLTFTRKEFYLLHYISAEMTFCLMSSPCLPSASHPLQFNLSSLSFTNSNRTNRKIHKIYFFICYMRSEKMKSKPKKSACKSYRSGKLRKASPNEQGNCFTRPIMTTWSKQWLTTSNGEPQMLSP